MSHTTDLLQYANILLWLTIQTLVSLYYQKQPAFSLHFSECHY